MSFRSNTRFPNQVIRSIRSGYSFTLANTLFATTTKSKTASSRIVTISHHRKPDLKICARPNKESTNRPK